MALGILTFSKIIINVTISIMAECYYAECHISFMLSVVMPRVNMLSVVASKF
jgi:hypothetical protein